MSTSMQFDPIDFLERAIQIPSHETVEDMRSLLIEELNAYGATPRIDDAGNTIASRGSGDPHVVLNTHIDTVPPHVPFERANGEFRGRGSCDAKGPLAALMDAFFRADAHVTLAVTPDEETISTGAAALTLDADAFIVGEPTGLDVCNAARGRFEGIIRIHGENAHAAEPESGVNAVGAAEMVLGALRTFDAAHGPGVHEDLGSPTVTPTVIRGGDTANQVPDWCEITIDRRSVPPETASGFRAALAEHVAEAVPSNVSVEVVLAERDTPYLEAFSTPPTEPLVEALAGASGGSVRPFTAATEASYFAEIAPTVVFGPGVLADDAGAVAHSDREYVRLDEVRRAGDAVSEAISVLTA